MSDALTRRVATLGALALPALARAQAAPTAKPAGRTFQELYSFVAPTAQERVQGLYLPSLVRWRTLTSAERETYGNLIVQTYALVGDEAGALSREAARRPSTPAFPIDSMRVEPAVEAIARRVRDRRLVILNEAHHVSRCRLFAEALALRLRRDGFRVLAAETFANDLSAAELNARPWRVRNGYYSGDPVFAEMLRAAQGAGYRFAAYEQRSDQESGPPADRQATRDAAEAANLEAVLKADPEARLLVYCGFAHATKVPDPRGGRWLAMRIAERTGLDPFCINQSTGYPGLDAAHEMEGVSLTLDRFRPREPVALWQADGRPWVFGYPDAAFDLQVVHPRLPDVEGRPGWLAAAPRRRRVRADLPAGLPAGTLVQAVREDEAALAPDVVPSDHYPLREQGSRQATFFLKPGTYRVRVETGSGRSDIGVVRA